MTDRLRRAAYDIEGVEQLGEAGADERLGDVADEQGGHGDAELCGRQGEGEP